MCVCRCWSLKHDFLLNRWWLTPPPPVLNVNAGHPEPVWTGTIYNLLYISGHKRSPFCIPDSVLFMKSDMGIKGVLPLSAWVGKVHSVRYFVLLKFCGRYWTGKLQGKNLSEGCCKWPFLHLQSQKILWLCWGKLMCIAFSLKRKRKIRCLLWCQTSFLSDSSYLILSARQAREDAKQKTASNVLTSEWSVFSESWRLF